MKNKFSLIIVIIITIIGFGVLWKTTKKEAPTIVTNFEECVSAGNPVMESYPRQCKDSDQTFVEDISGIKPNAPTSADNAPPGSIHNLPVPTAVSAVRTLVAINLGISEGVVIVTGAFEREWPNSCLGLAEEDELCAQVITPGFEVTVQAQGAEFIYHTNANGSVLRQKL